MSAGKTKRKKPPPDALPMAESKRKEAQMLVRVDTALRDAFVEACRARDTSASREIRRFMREYLASADSG